MLKSPRDLNADAWSQISQDSDYTLVPRIILGICSVKPRLKRVTP